jgi:uncharacterized protein
VVNAIYVNLAVEDLARSKRFFEELGFSFHEKFTNDDAAALILSDTIYAMLHTHESFARFTTKQIADTASTAQALLALQVDSRDEVNELADKAVAAGGREHRDPADHGFMYERAFEDPDGHIWEVFFMDVSQLPW